MVFEVLGETLLTIIQQSNYEGLSTAYAKTIVKQVLQGLDYMHAHCRIIHTDIKPENIMSVPNDLDVLENAVYAINLFKTVNFDESRMPISLVANLSKRHHSFKPTSKKKHHRRENNVFKQISTLYKLENAFNDKNFIPNEEYHKTWPFCRKPSFKFKIVDIGNACWTDRQFTNDIQTRQYRAPEIILVCGYDTSVDIWSVACLFFELITGDYLFDPRAGSYFTPDEDHLAHIWELLGKVPEFLIKLGKDSRNFFDKNGNLRHIRDLNIWKLSEVLCLKYKFSTLEAENISNFLLNMLDYDQMKRATAEQLLQMKFLADIDDNPDMNIFRDVSDNASVCSHEQKNGLSSSSDIDSTDIYQVG
ncbi:hypothetical protein A3Q56_03667 [Intoshia linei]|uniref:non-specific serine/threonine protein kinase n=1 Tax=Intoshia linei TaxID=1819745 RepID=A0A177B3Y5_9BILA|nr:hypothetical protein A3Q56_03667 [Intoshia linei]